MGFDAERALQRKTIVKCIQMNKLTLLIVMILLMRQLDFPLADI